MRFLWYRYVAKVLGWRDCHSIPEDISAIIKTEVYPDLDNTKEHGQEKTDHGEEEHGQEKTDHAKVPNIRTTGSSSTWHHTRHARRGASLQQRRPHYTILRGHAQQRKRQRTDTFAIGHCPHSTSCKGSTSSPTSFNCDKAGSEERA